MVSRNKPGKGFVPGFRLFISHHQMRSIIRSFRSSEKYTKP